MSYNYDDITDAESGGSVRSKINALGAAATDVTDRAIQLSRLAGPQHFGLLELPSVFSDIPVTIEQDFYGKCSGLSFDESDPAAESVTKTTYWVDFSASPGGSGTSEGDPIDSLSALFASINSGSVTTDVEVLVSAGVADYDRSLMDVNAVWYHGYNLSIRATSGDAYLTSGVYGDSLTWVADGDAFKAAKSGTSCVWDFSKKDYRKIPAYLQPASSVSECKSTPGSWYSDGVDLWIRTFDDRSPDADIIPNVDTGMNPRFAIQSNTTIYVEGIHFLGDDAVRSPLRISVNPAFTNAYYKFFNCSFCGSTSRNGLDSDYSYVFLKDCTAAFNYQDGFNYHESQSVTVEVGCHAYWNGYGSVAYTDNGSSAHDGMRILRSGCVGFSCNGPIFADVNGSYSYNVGCFGAASLRPDGATRANFYFDETGAGSAGQSWLIGCGGSDSLYDISSDGLAAINVRGWMGTPEVNSNTTINII